VDNETNYVEGTIVVDMRPEVVVIPVSDVDKAQETGVWRVP